MQKRPNPETFPPSMRNARRWMVACYEIGEPLKRPRAPFEKKPEDWPDLTPTGTPAKWPVSWNVPEAWGTLEEALAYIDRHELARCLCFVTHSGQSAGEVIDRWYVVDIDGGIKNGTMLPGVRDWLESIPSAYVETSLSGNGLHVVFRVKSSRLFAKKQQVDFHGAAADIYSDGQTLLTGDSIPFLTCPDDIEPISEGDFLSLLDGVVDMEEKVEGGGLGGDWPNQDQTQVDPEFAHLTPLMTDHGAAIEGQGGSLKLFAAAANLAREGVPLEATEALLRLLPAVPPFDTAQLRRTAACAYRDVEAKGEFGSGARNRAASEFSDVSVNVDEGDKGYGFDVWQADDLEASDQNLDYLVEGMFVDKEALFIGGREKCFKTSLAVDLAMSLTTGSHFLGMFPIIEKRKVSFFTGEIGPPAMKNLLRRVRQSKQVDQGSLGELEVIHTVPSFYDAKERVGLRKYLDDAKPQVVVFDPLYFAMGQAEVGDMYAIGRVLKDISSECRERDIWPIFCHHARKDQTKEYQPMELGDLYGSGVSAFARQWFLVAHSDPYKGGKASLVANVGGSTQGNCGQWFVTIDEGVSDEIADRRWDVKVADAEDGPSEAVEEKILSALALFDEGAKIKDIALSINRTDKQTRSILSDMTDRLMFRDNKIFLRKGTE